MTRKVFFVFAALTLFALAPHAKATTSTPVISSVRAEYIYYPGAQINWNTDVAADSKVFYGTTSGSYPSSVYGDCYGSAATTSHCVYLTGLQANTTYYYQARSYSVSYGTEGVSGEFNFYSSSSPSAVPSSPSLNAITATTVPVGLSWGTVSGASWYTLYRRNPPTTGSWAAVASNLSGTSYSDSSVSASTSYEYYVVACSSSGCSSSSNYQTVAVAGSNTLPTPSAPAGGTSVGAGASYSYSTYLYPDPNGYQVQAIFDWGDGGSTYATNFYTPSSTGLQTSLSHSWTTAGTYYVRVKERNTNSLDSSWSGNLAVTVSASQASTSVPIAPSGLSANATGTSVTLNWTDNSTNETRFEVYRQTGGGTWVYFSQTNAGVTYFYDYGLTAGTTYSYNVAACNGATVNTGCSGGSNNVTITVSIGGGGTGDTTPPSIPTNLAATYLASNQINLSWGASSDNVGVTGYKVYRSANAVWSQIGQGANIYYYDTTVTPASPYYYYVTAYDSSGNNSASSSQIFLNTPASTTSTATSTNVSLPPPPTLYATTVSSGQIDLSWVAPQTTATIAGYKIYRNGGFLTTTGATTLSYADRNLSPATMYSYNAASYDNYGNVSNFSPTASATTKPEQTYVASSTLNGVVQDSSGQPVGGAGVHVFSNDYGQNFGAMAAADGSFSITLPAGSYFVEVFPPYNRNDLVRPDQISFSVSSGDVRSVTLKFLSAAKTITGGVSFSNGQPITDAEVGAYSPYTHQWTSAFVDSTGHYALLVGSGDWQVGIRPKDSIAAKWSWSGSFPTVSFSSDVTLETKTVNFVIPTVDVTITVQTVDESGKAIPGAGVVLDTISASQSSSGGSRPQPQYKQSDALGNAVFSTQGGTYYLRAYLPQSAGYFAPDEKSVTVSSGDSRQVQLTFRKLSTLLGAVTLQGKTKLEDGTPTDAFVWAWSEKGASTQGRSSADGAFSLALSSGSRWHLGAGKEFNNAPYKSSEVVLDVKDQNVNAELVLSRAGISLSPPVNVSQIVTQGIVAQVKDGASISLPPQSVSGSGSVTVTLDPTVEAPSQAAAKVVGTVYDISIKDQGGIAIKQLQNEVQISLPYDDKVLKDQKVSLDSVVPSFFDDSTGAWVKIDNYRINKEDKVIVVKVKHLTRFALVAAADVNPPDAPSSVKVSQGKPGEVVLSWVNPKKDFDHVKIYRSQTKGVLGTIVLNDAAVSQFSDTKDTVNKSIYYYTVRAIDPAGNESTNTDQLPATASGSSGPSATKLTRTLNVGSKGDDVKLLQRVLVLEGVYTEKVINGSFGPLTRSAVVRFQEKYSADILKPAGLSKGSGVVGPGTRAKVNQLLP